MCFQSKEFEDRNRHLEYEVSKLRDEVCVLGPLSSFLGC